MSMSVRWDVMLAWPCASGCCVTWLCLWGTFVHFCFDLVGSMGSPSAKLLPSLGQGFQRSSAKGEMLSTLVRLLAIERPLGYHIRHWKKLDHTKHPDIVSPRNMHTDAEYKAVSRWSLKWIIFRIATCIICSARQTPETATFTTQTVSCMSHSMHPMICRHICRHLVSLKFKWSMPPSSEVIGSSYVTVCL